MVKGTVRTRQRRFLSLCMTFVMLLGMLPISARAAGVEYAFGSSLAEHQLVYSGDTVYGSGYIVYNNDTENKVPVTYNGEEVSNSSSVWEYLGAVKADETNEYSDTYYKLSTYEGLVITLDANGGKIDGADGKDQIFQSTTGGSLLAMSDRMSRDGLEFNGWNTSADGGGTAYADGAAIGSLSNNLTLYAQWIGTFSALQSLIDEADAGGTIQLQRDYKALGTEGALNVEKELTIDLNGHVIDRGLTSPTENGYVIGIPNGDGHLTIIDSAPTASHSPAITYTKPIAGANGAETVTVTGGVITGGYGNSGSWDIAVSGVCVSGGSLAMTGGTIVKNNVYAATGVTGVYVASGASFNMSGGAIAGNDTSNGTTVRVDGRFTMSDEARIVDNHAKSGAGVSINGSGTLYDGTISGNKADGNGGGVYVGSSDGTFTMRGGTIGGNKSENGGGVYLYNGGGFGMSAGNITGNIADDGGGVYIGFKSSFTMEEGEITGNSAVTDNASGDDGYGGGVYIEGGSDNDGKGSFTLSGGEITGNIANTEGGGVYQTAQNTKFGVSGDPVISGNKIAASISAISSGTDSNVLLNGSAYISVTDALDSGADIGVSSDAEEIAPGYSIVIAVGENDALTETDVAAFSSDDESYAVSLDEEGEAVLSVAPVKNVSYIDADGKQKTCPSAIAVWDGMEILGKSGEETWYVVKEDCDLIDEVSAAAQGRVNLILVDGVTLTALQGISVVTGDSLTVYAQSGLTGTPGHLYAGTADGTNPSINTYAAGIGGYGEGPNCGTVTINGGIVVAMGYASCAGIGGAGSGSCGNITINGGMVTAVGGTGDDGGVGIGGEGTTGGGITIDGGRVIATGGGVASGSSGTAGVGIGSRANATTAATVTLNWTSSSDSIFASSYGGTVNRSKSFVYLDEDENTIPVAKNNSSVTNDDLAGKSLLPGYVVSFDKGAGSGGDKMPPVGVLAGGAYTLPDCEFTEPTGYEFYRWKNSTALYESGDSILEDLLKTDPTFTANYTERYYDVVLETNGGTISGLTPEDNIYSMQYKYGVGATLPTADSVTLTGYSFGGWFDNDKLEGQAVTAIGTTETGNKEFYAKWTAKKSTLSFDYGSGSGSVSASGAAEYDKALPTLSGNVPTRDEYTFLGFFDASTDGTKYYNADLSAAVEKWDKDTEDGTTLYAQWEKNTFSVTLNAGEDATIAEGANVTSYTHGTAVTLPDKDDVTREGYDFGGWFDNDKCEGMAVTTISADATGDKEFFAKWTPTTYKIEYNLGGGSVSPENPTTYTIESGAITLVNPTREGFGFTGWTGTGLTAATTTVTIPAGSTGDREYTATWQEGVYTVTLHAGEGATITEGADVTSYTHGTAVTLPGKDDVTREGYDFGGWFDNDECEGTAVTTISADATGDKEFFAKWTPITYTISYDLDHGSISAENPTTYTIESGAITLNNPTRGGFSFAGWTGTGLTAATTTVTIPAGSTGDREYTATWSEAQGASIAIEQTTAEVEVDKTVQLTAVPYPSSLTVTWRSENVNYATVDQNGVVKGVAEGTVIIIAAITDPATGDELTASCPVTVKTAQTYSVEITESENGVTLNVGESVTLHANAVPSNTKVIWSSKNEKIAKVNSNGVVTGVSAGVTDIVATIYDADGKAVTAECTVTVNDSIASGSCGNGVEWVLEQSGTLIIRASDPNASGSPRMADYNAGGAPWFRFRDQITAVVVNSGVSYIGSNAFFACGALKKLQIADKGVTIGDRAFAYCTNLDTVVLTGAITSIGNRGFYACFRLSSQPSAGTAGTKAFELCGIDR